MTEVTKRTTGEPCNAKGLSTVRRGAEGKGLSNQYLVGGLPNYQRGELFGWEVRSYLLEKYHRQCVYCGATNCPFEIDHVLPRSRGGSHRVSNLVLSCRACNQAKGNQTAAEFGHAKVEQRAKQPLKDAAAVNTTRYALVEHLGRLGLPIGTWSGGRTRWNRDRFGVVKDHAKDALCVGDLTRVSFGSMRTIQVKATGRGRYGRTLVDGSGFPRGYLMQHKRVQGFQSGDLVCAEVPEFSRNRPLKNHGIHRGRLAVRETGSFRVASVDGINAKYCRVLQRADGYEYSLVPKDDDRKRTPSPHPRKEDLLPPHD